MHTYIRPRLPGIITGALFEIKQIRCSIYLLIVFIIYCYCRVSVCGETKIHQKERYGKVVHGACLPINSWPENAQVITFREQVSWERIPFKS